jgi:hypothetical protein
MNRIEKVSDLKVGQRVTLYKGEGELYYCRDNQAWYILGNSSCLDGSCPNNWDTVKEQKGVDCSYWICNYDDEGINYEVMTKDTLDSEWSFNPQPGDILHIMSEEDINKINKAPDLSGGGGYFGHHYKVTCRDSESLLRGEIIDSSGHVIISNWLLQNKDFYEYHRITPPVIQTSYAILKPFAHAVSVATRPDCKFSPGQMINILSEKYTSTLRFGGDCAMGCEAKVQVIRWDEERRIYVLTVDVKLKEGGTLPNYLLAEEDTYEFRNIIPETSITQTGEYSVAIGSNYTTSSAGLTLKDISSYTFNTSGSMVVDLSRDKPKHLEGILTSLRPTHDYEIRGDSVYRDRRLDSMILLNL